MRKKISKVVASILAVAMTVSLTATFSASAGSYSAKLDETKYRFYLANFDGASFPAGKNIEDIKGFGTDNKINDGPDKQFNATIEKYPLLGSANKALRLEYRNQDLAVAAKYTGIKIGAGKLFYNKTILNKDQGIKIDANDHGIMIHVELTNADGFPEEEGFAHISKNDKNEVVTAKNYQRDFNITFQERDYVDGKPVPHKSEEGKPQTTAMNVGSGNKITYIWTKDKTVSFNDMVWTGDGWEKNADGTPVYKEQTETHKKGDYSYYVTASNWDKSDGAIVLPHGFCGYVLIPFSSFSHTWSDADDDGKINLQYLELSNIYTSVYPEYRGQMWFDQMAFYGPTFANVEGAYEVTVNNSDPASFSQKKVDNAAPVASVDQGEFKPASGEEASTAASTEASAEEISAEEGSTEESVEETTSKEIIAGDVTPTDTNNNWWIWIVVGVVVLAGAGVGVFFYIKKRNASDDIEDLEGFDEDADGEEISENDEISDEAEDQVDTDDTDDSDEDKE